jgi:hypothetical protein
MAERWSTDNPGTPYGPVDGGLDTIALLQEEIARLEDEIRMRDEAAAAERHTPRPEPAARARDEAAAAAGEQAQRNATLAGALADREETIALLLEHLRLAEEAEAASRAEWEQLDRWVEEVERRVADRGESGDGGTLRDELEAERRTSDALRKAAEKERRSAEVQRQSLVAEVERLRANLTHAAGESDTTVAVVRALEFENNQLRDAYDELARNAVPPHEVDAIVNELQAVRLERDNVGQELKRVLDDQLRERNEHEAALNALRSQLARESLRRQEGQVKTAAPPVGEEDPRLDADIRLRAFREHLKEIHRDEAEQRMKRSLSTRLSRLWSHTGPNR